MRLSVICEVDYIGSTEAFARILEYKTHKDPTVISLALHLKYKQPIYFPEDVTSAEIQELLDNN
jgi:hypothetical protein